MIDYVFDPAYRGKYSKINMLMAAGHREIYFAYDFDKWSKMPDTSLYQTIDNPVEGWDKLVSFPIH